MPIEGSNDGEAAVCGGDVRGSTAERLGVCRGGRLGYHLAELAGSTHHQVHHQRYLFLLFFVSFLLSLFLLLCLCVPPASSNSLIVASHTIYPLAGLREDELLYLSGAGTAGKACGMV